MHTSPPLSPAAGADTPLANFSQCHDSIIQRLLVMETLPGLSAAAERSRQVATSTRAFFRNVIYNHHEEEERVLFEAVLNSAAEGAELANVKAITDRLTREHRQIETMFAQLEPELKKMAKGQASQLPTEAIDQLVQAYRGHAAFEETAFLPLSQTILSRNSNHMAALGLSLYVRHISQSPSPL